MIASLYPVMINFNASDFSERQSEEVISFFWRSVYEVSTLEKLKERWKPCWNYNSISISINLPTYKYSFPSCLFQKMCHYLGSRNIITNWALVTFVYLLLFCVRKTRWCARQNIAYSMYLHLKTKPLMWSYIYCKVLTSEQNWARNKEVTKFLLTGRHQRAVVKLAAFSLFHFLLIFSPEINIQGGPKITERHTSGNNYK